jgi:hypothetical protein
MATDHRLVRAPNKKSTMTVDLFPGQRTLGFQKHGFWADRNSSVFGGLGGPGFAPHPLEWFLRPPGPPKPQKATIFGRPQNHAFMYYKPKCILWYAIVLPNRKSCFRTGFWPDCYRESAEIGPSAGLRPAGWPITYLHSFRHS